MPEYIISELMAPSSGFHEGPIEASIDEVKAVAEENGFCVILHQFNVMNTGESLAEHVKHQVLRGEACPGPWLECCSSRGLLVGKLDSEQQAFKRSAMFWRGTAGTIRNSTHDQSHLMVGKSTCLTADVIDRLYGTSNVRLKLEAIEASKGGYVCVSIDVKTYNGRMRSHMPFDCSYLDLLFDYSYLDLLFDYSYLDLLFDYSYLDLLFDYSYLDLLFDYSYLDLLFDYSYLGLLFDYSYLDLLFDYSYLDLLFDYSYLDLLFDYSYL
ncbi:hypothetical protein CEUSTIGMA_g8248.t1, partial [Chlamydomonas eustigma]